MRNLLEETKHGMKLSDKTPADVRWVGTQHTWMTWDEFASVANVNYYDGYGGQEVCDDLVVVGDDWWLERHEYDGAEWWEFKRLPVRPDDHIISTVLELDRL